MGFRESLDVLADVLDGYREQGQSVRRVDVTTPESGGDALRVTVDVPVSLRAESGDGLRSGLAPEAARVTDDGEVRVELAATDVAAPPTRSDAVVAVEERDARLGDDGLVVTVELAVDPGAAAESAGTTGSGSDPSTDDAATDALAAARDESVPPYEDTEYLRALYGTRDSFAEMSREIPMDVSAETVRRYMIEAGIHEPTTYDTAASSADDGPATGGETADGPDAAPSAADPMADVSDEPLITDGLGLPGDLDLKDVADAVVDSRTTYEVHRHLGIDQARTRDLLKQLNLHDLVLRRVGGDPDRRVSYDEVTARIRECVPQEA